MTSLLKPLARCSSIRFVAFAAGALASGVALPPFVARAEVAVSANENKAVLDNGVTKTVPNPPPDTVSIIDLSASPPKQFRDRGAGQRGRPTHERCDQPGRELRDRHRRHEDRPE